MDNKWLNITLICESSNLPTYYEYCSLLESHINLTSSPMWIDQFDVFVIPCWNGFAIIDDAKLVYFLEKYFESNFLMDVKQMILTKYCGEQPVGHSILMKCKLEGGDEKYVCFVCVARTPSYVPIDFAYNCMWSALTKIKRYRYKHNIKEKWDVLFGSLTSAKNLPRDVDNISQQIATAIQNFSDDGNIDSLKSREQELDFIKSPRIKTREEKMDELEGLLWSRELDKRGLLSKLELDILIDWIATEAPNALSTASTLCFLLKNENPYALKSSTIAKAITRNSECLKRLIDYISKGQVKFYTETSKSEVNIRKKIGYGTSSAVHLAEFKGKEVAIKFILEEKEHELLKELSFLFLLKSDYIIQLLGVNIKSEKFFILELMVGSLYELIRDKSFELKPEMSIAIALQCAQCVKYFHSCGLIHRDLKSLNILFSKEFKFKLCDFGLSGTLKDKNMTANVGTVAWIAPEIFANKHYNQKVDVYSFGIILWEIVARDEPFSDVSPISIPLYVIRGERPVIPKYCDEKLKKLIKRCWAKNPSKRPSFNDIVSSLTDIYESTISIIKTTGREPMIVTEIDSALVNQKKVFTGTVSSGEIERDMISASVFSNDDESSYATTLSISNQETSDSDNIRIIGEADIKYPEIDEDLFDKESCSDSVLQIFSNLSINTYHGKISTPFQDRYLLLNPYFFTTDLKSLLNNIITLHSAEEKNIYTNHFLYEIGYQMGMSDSRAVKLLVNEEGIQGMLMLPYYLSYCGFSKCETLDASHFNDKDLYWVTRHKTSFSDFSEPELGCNFLAGYIAGWSTNMLGKTVICVEYHCRCRQNFHCEFAVSSKRYMSKNMRKFIKVNPYKYSSSELDAIFVPEFLEEHYSSDRWTESLISLLKENRRTLSRSNKRSKKRTRKKTSKSKTIRTNPKEIKDSISSLLKDFCISLEDSSIRVGSERYVFVRAKGLFESCHSNIRTLFEEMGVDELDLTTCMFSHEIGAKIGKRDSEIISTAIGCPIQRKQTILSEVFSRFGWGRVVPHRNGSDPVLIFEVEGTPETSIETGSCPFSRGYLAGFLEAGKKLIGIETSCNDSGICKFILTSEQSFDETISYLSMENPGLVETARKTLELNIESLVKLVQ
eukprot:TRINITY_DN8114_c0_g1_i1.p1 TRINITY_DN8114_c0_g1~~TRINITY_DN8114_c0_g1_i1.p1  ORF type:complete len:1122 (+),score=231.22 TRINITY_DN8114_c0_g1_i1:81-3446(+)